MNANLSYQQTGVMTRVNAFIRSTYNWMAIGLAATGMTSYFVSNSPAVLQVVYGNPMMPWVLFIGLILMCGFLGARIQKMQASTATGLYVALTVL